MNIQQVQQEIEDIATRHQAAPFRGLHKDWLSTMGMVMSEAVGNEARKQFLFALFGVSSSREALRRSPNQVVALHHWLAIYYDDTINRWCINSLRLQDLIEVARSIAQ